MTVSSLTGLGVALATPFNDDYSVDFTALKALIEHVISGGVDYIVALGTTAETPTLSREEKILLTDFIRENVAGRVPLVIGIGGNNTKKVAELLSSRDLSGYCAVLSVTPFYNRPSQQGLIRHYDVISQASPLPVILYNVPNRTGVNLSAETTLEIADRNKKIIGIKEASGNLKQITEILNNKPEDFLVISGDDSLTCELMKSGACGVISVMANAFPHHIKQIVDHCSCKRFLEAESRQVSLKDLCGNIFRDGNPSGVKYALSKLGISQNIVRLPLVSVSESTAEKIDISMQALGL